MHRLKPDSAILFSSVLNGMSGQPRARGCHGPAGGHSEE